MYYGPFAVHRASGGKKILWEISMKFTTFEESIGKENAKSERKGPEPKLGMR